ncbi:hypothetical protein Tco_1244791 [Tanacetum coccineum]
MGDANPIRTLGDYSKPSHEGYRNTIELPVGNNVVPLRSDTIRLVQNGCSFHGLQSEDPNQHLKDFLKLVDSLDLDGESLSEAWARFKDLLQKVPHHGIDLWLQALLEDLALYDNESWNDPRDFSKPVKEISLPQDVPSTSDRRLIELENQVQRLMEAHLAPTQPAQVNKITSSSVSEKLDDAPTRDTAGNPAAQMNFTSTNDPTREEHRGKGIKSPSKLLSPKYLSQSSLAEQNRNPSSPKRVYFVNSIGILNKEDETKEEGNVKTSITEYDVTSENFRMFKITILPL